MVSKAPRPEGGRDCECPQVLRVAPQSAYSETARNWARRYRCTVLGDSPFSLTGSLVQADVGLFAPSERSRGIENQVFRQRFLAKNLRDLFRADSGNACIGDL